MHTHDQTLNSLTTPGFTTWTANTAAPKIPYQCFPGFSVTQLKLSSDWTEPEKKLFPEKQSVCSLNNHSASGLLSRDNISRTDSLQRPPFCGKNSAVPRWKGSQGWDWGVNWHCCLERYPRNSGGDNMQIPTAFELEPISTKCIPRIHTVLHWRALGNLEATLHHFPPTQHRRLHLPQSFSPMKHTLKVKNQFLTLTVLPVKSFHCAKHYKRL